MSACELTHRVQSYLSRMERVPVPTTLQVQEELEESVDKVPLTWLDFHERYGGYVQTLGADLAVLGIMHFQSKWIQPLTCRVESDQGEDDFYVTCADVHPSFSYELTKRGHFLGGPSESFEVYLERCALEVEFKGEADNGVDIYYELISVPSSLQGAVSGLLQGNPIDEASDSYETWFRSRRLLVRQVGSRVVVTVRR